MPPSPLAIAMLPAAPWLVHSTELAVRKRGGEWPLITPAGTDGCLFSAVFCIRRYHQVFILESYLPLVRGLEICSYVSCLL
jgi:hypothetical protein